MESIKRLREYVNGIANVSSMTKANMSIYIDSIDKEVDDMWHALTIDAKPMTDENMAADGWVRLPLDADGVPIHVGDVMEFSAFEIEKPVTRMVDGIGQGVFFAWCGERGYQQHEVKRYRHHHAPTVEDVLREFVERLDEIGSEDDCVGVDEQECRACIRRDIAAVYAEYAAKLRLAGEDA